MIRLLNKCGVLSEDKVEVSKDGDNMSPAAANRVLSTIYSGKFCVTSVQCPQPQLAAITTVVAAQLFLPTTQPVHSAPRDANKGSRRLHKYIITDLILVKSAYKH